MKAIRLSRLRGAAGMESRGWKERSAAGPGSEEHKKATEAGAIAESERARTLAMQRPGLRQRPRSVNASRKDFETGLYRLRQIDEKFPGWLGRMMTDRLTLEEVPRPDFSRINIKAVVDLVPQPEWRQLLETNSYDVQYSFPV